MYKSQLRDHLISERKTSLTESSHDAIDDHELEGTIVNESIRKIMDQCVSPAIKACHASPSETRGLTSEPDQSRIPIAVHCVSDRVMVLLRVGNLS